jgi:hypothetical protein
MKLNLEVNENKKENENKNAEEWRKESVNAIYYSIWSGGPLGQMYQKCSHLIPKGTD